MSREKGAVVAGDGVAVDCRRGSSGSRGRTLGPRGRTLGPHGRTLSLAVVLWGASNVRPRGLRYDRTTQCTTARIRVRPRGTAYDCEAYPGRACTGCPVRCRSDARRRAVLTTRVIDADGRERRCPQEGGPHRRAASSRRARHSGTSRTTPPSDSCRNARLVAPAAGRGALGPISVRNRTDLGAELNRSRCGTGPISARGTGRATPAGPGITSDRDVSSQFPVGWDARPRRGRPPARRRAPARIIPIDEGALHAGSCREGL